MKAAGILLLLAGLAIVKSALIILPVHAPRGGFVVAGIAVQLLGLGLLFRAYMPFEGEQ